MSEKAKDTRPLINVLAERLMRSRGKQTVWVVGNGGCSSIASHFASDLMNLGCDARCLTDNVARLTGLINDKGWDYVYYLMLHDGFQIEDFLVVFSVHGCGEDKRSRNLVEAVRCANSAAGQVWAFVGIEGGTLADLAENVIRSASSDPYIVESEFATLTHMICAKMRGERPMTISQANRVPPEVPQTSEVLGK